MQRNFILNFLLVLFALLLNTHAAAQAVLSDPITPQIVNGEPTQADEFEQYVLVLIFFTDIQRFGACGGILIAPDKVLTAAHCADIEGRNVELSVIPGFYRMADRSAPERTIKVSKQVIHPDYFAEFLIDDIAILTLERSVTYKPAKVFLGADPLIDRPATVVGYGLVDQMPQRFPTVLQKFDTVITDNDLCNEYFIEEPFDDNRICLKKQLQSSPGVCFGDSGGPLLSKIGGSQAVVGIASFLNSDICNEELVFSGFTRVSAYTDFIKQESPQTKFARAGDAAIGSIISSMLLNE